jgi:predicted GNAT superfamily acetyltransferase
MPKTSQNTPNITIRRCETPADYRACQVAQRRAWGIQEDGYVVPVATMAGANLHGGVVLGAFDTEGQAVGLSFAFLGQVDGQIGLYSQLTGVVPECQGLGLGEALKRRQRDLAREAGLPCIAWAFDPLQAGNAHFNLARLGAVAVRYVDNMYGLRSDALNAGVPSDRVIVVWPTGPDGDPRKPPAPDVYRKWPCLLAASPEWDGGPPIEAIEGPPPAMTAPIVRIEVPPDIANLRRSDPATAERWRQAVRRAFHAAFEAGYRATDFVRDETTGRAHYIVARG